MDAIDYEEIAELMRQGMNLMDNKEFTKAEEIFKKALQLEDNLTIRNNLAAVIFLTGDLSRALAVLEPNLDDSQSPAANPYSFGLAAQIYALRGREKEGRAHLKKAIASFDRGKLVREKLNIDEQAWNEYTVTIMRGAAALKDHRQVYDLYRRWERCHVNWENRYLAGVAAFNLGRYRRAASLWGALQDTGPYALHMQQVAFLVERALIPPFELEYKPFDPDALGQLDPEKPQEVKDKIIQSYVDSTAARAVALSYLFSPDINEDSAEAIISTLVQDSGDWGVTFGKRLLEAAAVSREFKMIAAVSLVKIGVFKKDEPISILVEGKEEKIKVLSKVVSLEKDPKLDRLDQKARKLRDQGRPREAIRLLEPLYEEGNIYPPAMITLANLYRTQDRLEEAQDLLEMLDDFIPGQPAILFNLAGLWIQQDDYEVALDYLEQLAGMELEDTLSARVSELREMAKMNIKFPNIDRMKLIWDEEGREEVEKKLLPLEAPLLRGLKNMPNEWLLNICLFYSLENVRRRPDREKLIASMLNREKVLKKAVLELDQSERDLLIYLLQRKGWARLNAVTRKFGTMQGDGYYWLEEDPRSTLGRLWSRALVMVGRARLPSGYARVAAIPEDLRQKLALILDVTPGSKK